ncbi:5769_t:CDS:1, partial [Paraglomus brasilianum]
MAWPPLPLPTKDGEATHSVEVNIYAEETWIEGNDSANNDNVSNEANNVISPITLSSAIRVSAGLMM